MMPGMWVVRADGTPWQVLRLITTTVNVSRGVPIPATKYELLHGDEVAYVDQWNRNHSLAGLIGRDPEQLTILPACSVCGVSAGWGCGHEVVRAGQHTSEGEVA